MFLFAAFSNIKMDTAFHQSDDALFQNDLMRLANSPDCVIPPLSPSGSNSAALPLPRNHDGIAGYTMMKHHSSVNMLTAKNEHQCLEEAGAAHCPYPSHNSDESHTSCSNVEVYSDGYSPATGRYCGAGGVDPHAAMAPPMRRAPTNPRQPHSHMQHEYGSGNSMQQMSSAAHFRSGPNGMMGVYGQQPAFSSPFATRQASCHLPDQDLFNQTVRSGLMPSDEIVVEGHDPDDDALDVLLQSAIGNGPDDASAHACSFPSFYPHMPPPPPPPFNRPPIGRFGSAGHMRHPPRFHNGGEYGHMMVPSGPQQLQHQQLQQQHSFGYGATHPSMVDHSYLAFSASASIPVDRTMSAPVLPPPMFDSFVPVNAIFADSPTKRKAAAMLVNPRQHPSPVSTPRSGSGLLNPQLQQQLLLQQLLPPSPASGPITPRGGGLPPRCSPATTPRGGVAASQGVSPVGGAPGGVLTTPRNCGLPPISPASTPRGAVGVPGLVPSASPVTTPRVSQSILGGSSMPRDSRIHCSSSSFMSGEATDDSCTLTDDVDPSKTTLDMLGDLEPSLMPLLLQKAKRKGKGGRSPALDPRLDPEVDPKKAKRILANRMSAAKSKLKQKLMMEGLRAKHEVLKKHKDTHQQELEELRRLCGDLEAKNLALQAKVETLDGGARVGSAASAPSTPLSLSNLFVSPSGTPGGATDTAGGTAADGGCSSAAAAAAVAADPDFSLLLPGVPDTLLMFDNVHVSDNFIRTSDGGMDPDSAFAF